ncbi:MAG: CYTH domain-containing protein [Oceanospirillaceae bacterium]
MKQEIEVKLSIDPNKVAKLLNCDFIIQLASKFEKKQLGNTYYDTVQLELKKKRIALRVRNSDGKFIQTLKTQGQSNDGLHQRLEWEWDLPTQQLDCTLLPTEHWPQQIDPHQLKAIFSTNFTRQLWYFEHTSVNGVSSNIEMALDQGLVETLGVDKTITISELELELVSGDASALQEVAQILMKECTDLQPSDVSKAAKGYTLLAQNLS